MRGWIPLARPFTLLAPALGTLAGAAAARGALDEPWRVPVLALAVAAAASATVASNAWNQAFDAEIDRRNKPNRPVPAGLVSRRQALGAGHAAALLTLALGALVSPAFLGCVGVGLLATWIYSAPPLRTKRRLVPALVTIAIPRGLLVPVAGWSVVAAPVRPDPWALGIVSGLYVLGAAATKDFADVEGDRAHGCRTLPIAWGPARAARLVAPFLVAPFLLLPAFALAGWIDLPLAHVGVLTAVLVVAGGVTARALLADPTGLAARGGTHPAWIGMYLTLVLYHVGYALAYAL